MTLKFTDRFKVDYVSFAPVQSPWKVGSALNPGVAYGKVVRTVVFAKIGGEDPHQVVLDEDGLDFLSACALLEESLGDQFRYYATEVAPRRDEHTKLRARVIKTAQDLERGGWPLALPDLVQAWLQGDSVTTHRPLKQPDPDASDKVWDRYESRVNAAAKFQQQLASLRVDTILTKPVRTNGKSRKNGRVIVDTARLNGVTDPTDWKLLVGGALGDAAGTLLDVTAVEYRADQPANPLVTVGGKRYAWNTVQAKFTKAHIPESLNQRLNVIAFPLNKITPAAAQVAAPPPPKSRASAAPGLGEQGARILATKFLEDTRAAIDIEGDYGYPPLFEDETYYLFTPRPEAFWFGLAEGADFEALQTKAGEIYGFRAVGPMIWCRLDNDRFWSVRGGNPGAVTAQAMVVDAKASKTNTIPVTPLNAVAQTMAMVSPEAMQRAAKQLEEYEVDTLRTARSKASTQGGVLPTPVASRTRSQAHEFAPSHTTPPTPSDVLGRRPSGFSGAKKGAIRREERLALGRVQYAKGVVNGDTPIFKYDLEIQGIVPAEGVLLEGTEVWVATTFDSDLKEFVPRPAEEDSEFAFVKVAAPKALQEPTAPQESYPAKAVAQAYELRSRQLQKLADDLAKLDAFATKHGVSHKRASMPKQALTASAMNSMLNEYGSRAQLVDQLNALETALEANKSNFSEKTASMVSAYGYERAILAQDTQRLTKERANLIDQIVKVKTQLRGSGFPMLTNPFGKVGEDALKDLHEAHKRPEDREVFLAKVRDLGAEYGVLLPEAEVQAAWEEGTRGLVAYVKAQQAYEKELAAYEQGQKIQAKVASAFIPTYAITLRATAPGSRPELLEGEDWPVLVGIETAQQSERQKAVRASEVAARQVRVEADKFDVLIRETFAPADLGMKLAGMRSWAGLNPTRSNPRFRRNPLDKDSNGFMWVGEKSRDDMHLGLDTRGALTWLIDAINGQLLQLQERANFERNKNKTPTPLSKLLSKPPLKEKWEGAFRANVEAYTKGPRPDLETVGQILPPILNEWLAKVEEAAPSARVKETQTAIDTVQATLKVLILGDKEKKINGLIPTLQSVGTGESVGPGGGDGDETITVVGGVPTVTPEAQKTGQKAKEPPRKDAKTDQKAKTGTPPGQPVPIPEIFKEQGYGVGDPPQRFSRNKVNENTRTAALGMLFIDPKEVVASTTVLPVGSKPTSAMDVLGKREAIFKELGFRSRIDIPPEVMAATRNDILIVLVPEGTRTGGSGKMTQGFSNIAQVWIAGVPWGSDIGPGPTALKGAGMVAWSLARAFLAGAKGRSKTSHPPRYADTMAIYYWVVGDRQAIMLDPPRNERDREFAVQKRMAGRRELEGMVPLRGASAEVEEPLAVIILTDADMKVGPQAGTLLRTAASAGEGSVGWVDESGPTVGRMLRDALRLYPKGPVTLNKDNLPDLLGPSTLVVVITYQGGGKSKVAQDPYLSMGNFSRFVFSAAKSLGSMIRILPAQDSPDMRLNPRY